MSKTGKKKVAKVLKAIVVVVAWIIVWLMISLGIWELLYGSEPWVVIGGIVGAPIGVCCAVGDILWKIDCWSID